MRGAIAAVVGVLVVVSSVAAQPAMRATEREGYSWYQFQLVDDEQRGIPFYATLPDADGASSAYIHNAEEEIEVDAVRRGDQITLSFPHYDSYIKLEIAAPADREQPAIYEGTWAKRRGGGMSEMRVRARKYDGVPLLYSEVMRKAPEKARYEIDFEQSGKAVGDFTIYHLVGVNSVVGTILTPTGDYRFLSGEKFRGRLQTDEGTLRGELLALSVFDGAHAFAFVSLINPDTGDLANGHFYSGNHWHETFTARRLAEGEEYELPDPFAEVSLKPGVTRLGIPKLSEPPYAGKPTIVQVFGTWCPNCHDEAPALVDLYERFHDDGLQILSLAYEYTDDAERSARQIERFKERHGATWEFVAAGVNDKQKTAATLPALSSIKSYPTTIWINPDGTVRAIHSGFSGPATGAAHEETLAEFDKLTREIVEAQ